MTILSAGGVAAQTQTVGLLQYDRAASYDGYTLLAPWESNTIYLIDNYGRLVHSWERQVVASSETYLLPNGHLLRGAKTVDSTGGIGRTIQEIDWDNTVVWSFDYSSPDHIQHHDIEPLPNGNVLLLAKERLPSSEAIAAGRDPSLISGDILSPEMIVEIQPTGPNSGEIVWEWHAWDHLIQDFDDTLPNYGVVGDHPELIDLNFVFTTSDDWLHANSIAYNDELDQVMISLRHFNEVWIIDHSTTSQEAAGHTGGNNDRGGDLLYRWGNPQTYRAGAEQDCALFGQHDAHWIGDGLAGEGDIMVFNNGWYRPEGSFSTVDEFTTPVDAGGQYPSLTPGESYGPDSASWIYTADPPTDFYSPTISGAQRLPNGNTLVCTGRKGWIFEVTPTGDIVWQYQNPVTQYGPMNQGETSSGSQDVFRAHRYAPDFPGLVGRSLSPGSTIELYDITISSSTHLPADPSWNDSVVVTAAVWSDSGVTSATLYVDTGAGFTPKAMYDDGAHSDGEAEDSVFGVVIPPHPGGVTVTYYIEATDRSSAVVQDPVYAPTNAVYSYQVGNDLLCGDVDGNYSGPDIGDLVYLVDYMFTSGPPPPDLDAANVDGLGEIDISDLVYLVDYMFTGGPPPICP